MVDVPKGQQPGFEVRIHGLTNKAELNGKDGTAKAGLKNKAGEEIDGYVVSVVGAGDVKIFRKNLKMRTMASKQVHAQPPVPLPESVEMVDVPKGQQPGFEVRIHGLTNKAELNGKDGTAKAGLKNKAGEEIDGYVVSVVGAGDVKIF